MLSIIIPAYNEELLLGRTLSAAHQAALAVGEPYEIVVADDASTDRTAAIARENGTRVVQVKCRQISATRNAGARMAQGDVFFFVDADTLISAAVLRGALEAIRAGAVGGVAGFHFDEPCPAWVRAVQPFMVWLFRMVGFTGGCFLFCTRQAFTAVGGFSEDLYASEELTMCLALKRQGRFVVLREVVTTSGRKLRAYSMRELICIMCRIGLRGTKAVRDRAQLEIWYGKRRTDPGTVS